MFKKSIIMGIAAVGAMSLVGTGFAGWVISRSVQKVETGNVQAYAVAKNNLSVTVEKTAPSIIFGTPDGYDPQDTGKWLTATQVDPEVLTTTFTITVGNFPSASSKCYFSYKLELPSIASTLAPVAITGSDGINSAGPIYNIEKAQTNNQAVFTITVTYTWGSAFHDDNPYTYYNGEDYSDDLADEVEKNLTDLKAAVDAHPEFKLTVVVGTATSAAEDSIFTVQAVPANPGA